MKPVVSICIVAICSLVVQCSPDFEYREIEEEFGELEDYGKLKTALTKIQETGDLKQGEAQLDDWEETFGVGSGRKVALLWGTPFLRLRADEVLPDLKVNITELNQNLTRSILSLYAHFERQYGPTLYELAGKQVDHGQGTAGNFNNAFYRFQVDGGWDKYLADKPHFKLWKELAVALYDQFAEACDVPNLEASVQEAIDEGEQEDAMREEAEISPWATVHRDCNSHSMHDHPDSAFSAVYYVKVPKLAGNIVFHDPRPLGDNDLTLTPREGDFIMFPSWLKHEVTSTRGTEDRISIAWNTFGDWGKVMEMPPVEMPKRDGDNEGIARSNKDNREEEEHNDEEQDKHERDNSEL